MTDHGVSLKILLERLQPNISVGAMDASGSPFVKPQSVFYTLDGIPRRWDMVESYPSVAVLLYHTSKDAVVLVRQFRPAVYVSEMQSKGKKLDLMAGVTLELCAGIIDKPGLSLRQIARDEVLEECGFDVPIENFVKIASHLSAIGTSGSRQTLYFAEVNESMASTVGGGLIEHGEAIEVLLLPRESIDNLLTDESIAVSSGLLFSLLWLQKHVNDAL